MSWSFISVGKKSNVKPIVEAYPTLPSHLKAAIIESIDALDGYDGVEVQSNGHHGGGIGLLLVRPLSFEHDPLPENENTEEAK